MKLKKKSDRVLFFSTAILTLLGLIFVADVSAPMGLSYFSDSFYFVKQQLVWGLLGFISLIISSSIHYSFWKKISTPFFYISIILLILVLIPGLGSKLLGARRWINLGPINIQPSELVKLSLILYLSNLIDEGKKILSFLIPIALVAFLIMLQPDLGTTVIALIISLTLLFISGINIFKFIGVISLGGIVGLFSILLSPYRRLRLLTFLDKARDPLGDSYHIRQILLALGSGGLFGVGLGHSRQKYLFLPETATDSIFAIIGEELGFIGATTLILFFLFFLYRIISISLKSKDKFAMSVSLGIAVWIGSQMILNIGSMTALVPLTGVPLPFFSYGGSSLTVLLFTIGILLNISKEVSYGKFRR